MFNLLPETEKDSILAEYKVRRGIVFFSFLLVLGLVGIASIFPSYLYSAAKVRDAKSNIQAIEHSDIFAEETGLNSDLAVAKVKLTALQPNNQSSVGSLIDALESDRSEDVRVNGILFTRTPHGTSTISVNGVARDRGSLSSFVDTLKKDPLWTTVDLPVSNFAKDSNNTFTLQLGGSF